MLVLSRKIGERILIGDDVVITVARITGGGVRLGVEAPRDLPVVREELTVAPDVPKPYVAGNAAVDRGDAKEPVQ